MRAPPRFCPALPRNSFTLPPARALTSARRCVKMLFGQASRAAGTAAFENKHAGGVYSCASKHSACRRAISRKTASRAYCPSIRARPINTIPPSIWASCSICPCPATCIRASPTPPWRWWKTRSPRSRAAWARCSPPPGRRPTCWRCSTSPRRGTTSSAPRPSMAAPSTSSASRSSGWALRRAFSPPKPRTRKSAPSLTSARGWCLAKRWPTRR